MILMKYTCKKHTQSLLKILLNKNDIIEKNSRMCGITGRGFSGKTYNCSRNMENRYLLILLHYKIAQVIRGN
jgi:hypothetical protein